MQYEVAAAAGAGLIGGVAMVVPLYLARAMTPAQMRMDLLLLLGTMVPAPVSRAMAYGLGGMMHAGASIAFAFAHVGVFVAADIDSDVAVWGLLFGAGHWALSGVALGMMPVLHPRVRTGDLENPGAFATGMGPNTAMGFLIVQLLFGVVVAVFYDAFTILPFS